MLSFHADVNTATEYTGRFDKAPKHRFYAEVIQLKKKEFPFSDAPNTACFTCRHVLEEKKPIRYVSHDEDGYWQFLCGGTHRQEDARVVSLADILEIDATMHDLAELDYGEYAEIEGPAEKWVVRHAVSGA